jgi:hypothetical protein
VCSGDLLFTGWNPHDRGKSQALGGSLGLLEYGNHSIAARRLSPQVKISLQAAIALALCGVASGASDRPETPFNDARIMGVLPDFQTITEHGTRATPLTRKQKWNLAWKETVDPFNLLSAAMGAGFSQVGNQTPKYGNGVPAYGKRFGAAVGDFATQNVFSAGVLASTLHQDPRYFRKGSEAGVAKRILYSVSRVAVTRQDSGKRAFNASGILGMAMGIAASNLYYPKASVRGTVMAGRLETSLFGGVSGNLLSEFWPDLQRKFFHRKR